MKSNKLAVAVVSALMSAVVYAQPFTPLTKIVDFPPPGGPAETGQPGPNPAVNLAHANMELNKFHAFPQAGSKTYYDPVSQWNPLGNPNPPGPNDPSRGWTHNSAWATFTIEQDKMVVIKGKVDESTVPVGETMEDYHPAFVLWRIPDGTNFTGALCQAPTPTQHCVPAHLWSQYADWGWTGGQDSSNPQYTLEWAYSSYDADLDNDSNNGLDLQLHPVLDPLADLDGMPGMMTTGEFMLPKGNYLMVVSNAPGPTSTGGVTMDFAVMDFDLDHYTCYRVKNVKGFQRMEGIHQANQFDAGFFKTKKVTKLCVPSIKEDEIPELIHPEAHLLCYRARFDDTHERRKNVVIENQWGKITLDTVREKEFCVPSTKMLMNPEDQEDH